MLQLVKFHAGKIGPRRDAPGSSPAPTTFEMSDLNEVHTWASWGAAMLRPYGLLLEVDGLA
jgi:hypothetical protein